MKSLIANQNHHPPAPLTTTITIRNRNQAQKVADVNGFPALHSLTLSPTFKPVRASPFQPLKSALTATPLSVAARSKTVFKKTRKQIHNTIEGLKDAFRLFVVTVQHLTLSIDNNSATVAANTATVTANTAANKSLIDKFDILLEHSHFMVKTKKRELERSGHRAE
jgi:hypothetical protein